MDTLINIDLKWTTWVCSEEPRRRLSTSIEIAVFQKSINLDDIITYQIIFVKQNHMLPLERLLTLERGTRYLSRVQAVVVRRKHHCHSKQWNRAARMDGFYRASKNLMKNGFFCNLQQDVSIPTYSILVRRQIQDANGRHEAAFLPRSARPGLNAFDASIQIALSMVVWPASGRRVQLKRLAQVRLVAHLLLVFYKLEVERRGNFKTQNMKERELGMPRRGTHMLKQKKRYLPSYLAEAHFRDWCGVGYNVAFVLWSTSVAV